MKNLSVIVPVFNGDKYIKERLCELNSALLKESIDYEIIVVNDGSSDETLEKLNELKIESLKFYSYRNNLGKGYAIKYGFSKATGNFICFIDGDLDIPGFQVVEFYKEMVKELPDSIIGSKRKAGTVIKWSAYRNFISAGFICIINVLFPWLRLKDTQVGLKIFKRSGFEVILPYMLENGWIFDLELLLNLRRQNCNILEHPVIISPKSRTSNLTLNSVFKIGYRIIFLFYRFYISKYYNGVPKLSQ